MPAHIIRSLIGVRESAASENLHLCPNLPDAFMTAGRRYGITRVRCGGAEIGALEYRVIDRKKLLVSVDLPSGVSIQSVLVGENSEKSIQRGGRTCRFDAVNHERCSVRMSTTSS